jgi:hypothetical protein
MIPASTDWDSVEDHMNFLKDEERQAPFAKQFADAQKPGTNDVLTKHTVLPTEVALRCLHAPLTEFASIKVKEGASLETVRAIVDKYVAYANKESTAPVAAVYGHEAGNEKELVIVIGWESTEVSFRLDSSTRVTDNVRNPGPEGSRGI